MDDFRIVDFFFHRRGCGGLDSQAEAHELFDRSFFGSGNGRGRWRWFRQFETAEQPETFFEKGPARRLLVASPPVAATPSPNQQHHGRGHCPRDRKFHVCLIGGGRDFFS
jgi:hypothetical protein